MTKFSLSPNRARLIWLISTLAVLLPAPVLAGSETPGVKTQVLARTTSAWNGVPYGAYPAGSAEITVLRITIPAHCALPWHTHPMPNAAYVVSGDITVEVKKGVKRHFSAGEVIPETVGILHRGIVGDQPAELIVFYAGVRGMPLSEKKK